MLKIATLLVLVGAPAFALAGGRPTGGSIWALVRNRKLDFQQTHPCPANGKKSGNCPGYQIGFILVPREGGSLTEDNMRWMTNDEYDASHQPYITE
jgi:hypothetical protein